MLPSSLEPLPKKPLKLQKRLPIHAPQHLDILQWQLKRCGLKPHITRRLTEHEAEVYMDEIAGAVEEEVAVVTVFYLEEVADY